MAEIMDIYDGSRAKTGKTHIRGSKRRPGEYVLVVMVLIFNTKGEMLIQQRPKHVGWEPGMWSMTAGGAVMAGETPAAAAKRELFEELGIEMDFTNRCPKFAMTSPNTFIDYFLVRTDIELAALNVPNNEVAAVKWASKKDMLALIDKGQCISYRKSFLEFCFDCADMRESTIVK